MLFHKIVIVATSIHNLRSMRVFHNLLLPSPDFKTCQLTKEVAKISRNQFSIEAEHDEREDQEIEQDKE
jgi:hypothetical protein